MIENGQTTLMEAVRLYLETLPDDDRIASQAEVQRFARWCGTDRPCGQLRAQEVANYGETLTGTVTNAAQRADAVRRFLAFAKKEGLTSTKLATHLRLRKAAGARQKAAGPAPKEVILTEQAKAAMESELNSLKAQRPEIVADIRRAMEDKDFRENAPLDAAKDRQGHVEGRIRSLEAALGNAVMAQDRAGPSGETAEIGSTVLLRNLSSGAEVKYVLVRPHDVNAAEGRISVKSPVGRAVRERKAGDEVEVEVPSGTVRFRIEGIE